MSATDQNRNEQVWELFERCRNLPAEKWRQLLSETYASQPNLAAEVEELLVDRQAHRGFLERALSPKSAEHHARLAIGNIVTGTSEYRVVGKPVHGGMGEVYLAHRKAGNYEQPLALKFVRSDRASPRLLEAFQVEQRILADLSSDHVVRIYASGSHADGSPFLVMEYIVGLPITRYCEVHALSRNQMLRLFVDVAETIGRAHDRERPIVHADIKPSHLLVTPEGSVKIIDFGAGVLGDFGEPVAHTEPFASPQQLAGERPVPADDVHALGKVLELLCAQLPARGWRESCLKGDVDAIITRCLSKGREGRYQSATPLTADIKAALESRPVSAHRGTIEHRTYKWMFRHPVIATALVIAAIASGVGMPWWLNNWREARIAADAQMAIEQLTEDPRLAVALAYRASQESDAPHVIDALRRSISNPLQRVLRVPEGKIVGLAFSADGQFVAATTLSGDISLLRVSDSAVLWTESVLLCQEMRPYFLANDKLLALDCEGRTIFMDLLRRKLLSDKSDLSALSLVDSNVEQNIVTLTNEAGLRVLAFEERLSSIGFSGISRSSDAQYVAGIRDGRLLLWNDKKKSWSPLIDQGSTEVYKELSFITSAHTILAVGLDDFGLLYNLDTHKTSMLKGPTDWSRITFSSNGRFAAGIGKTEVRVWNTATKDLIARQAILTASSAVAIDSTGNTLAVSDRDSTIRLWRIRNPVRIGAEWTLRNPASLAFDSTGRYLAVSTKETIAVWDVTTKESLLPTGVPGFAHYITSASFDASGQRLVVSDEKSGLQQWNLQQRKVVMQCCQHSAPVARAVYSPDGSVIVSQLANEDSFIWDAHSGQLLRHLIAKGETTSGGQPPPAFRTDSEGVAIIIRGRLYTENFSRSPKARPEPVTGHDELDLFVQVGLAPTAVVAKLDVGARYLLAIDRPREPTATRLQEEDESIGEFVLSPSRRLMGVGVGQALRVWSLVDRRLVASLGSEWSSYYSQIDFSKDDRFVLTMGHSSGPQPPRVMIWDINTKRLVFDVPGRAAAMSPDGAGIAVVSGDAAVSWYDTPELIGSISDLKAHALRRFKALTSAAAK